MSAKLKTITKVFSIVLLVYILLCAGFYSFQDRLIFQSEELPKEFVFKFDQKFEEFFISADDGTELSTVLFKTEQPPRGLILYFHGNAGSLEKWGKYASDFTKNGYDILMVDYRGYGKSTGTPTEDDLYKDALTVWNWTEKNFSYVKVIIYGRSLGAAVASSLAARTNPDLLILETPFDELKGAFYPSYISQLYFFPIRFHFPNHVFLKDVKCRKVIMHGTYDMVIPISSAEKLKPLLSGDDLFVVIEGGSHNNLRDFELYHKTLTEVLND